MSILELKAPVEPPEVALVAVTLNWLWYRY